jgi:hypothetical protein
MICNRLRKAASDVAELQWFGTEVQSQLTGMGQNAARAAADRLVELVKANISTQGPPRSLPGEFPHRDEGTLEASITAVPNADGTGYSVGSDDPVALWLELGTVAMSPRPFLTRTALESGGELGAAAVAGAQGGAGGISDADIAAASARLSAAGGTRKGGYARAGGGRGGGGKRKKSVEIRQLEKELKKANKLRPQPPGKG